jgi:homoserine kinase
MGVEADIIGRVREAAKKKILFLPHAVRQMTHPDRMVTTAEVRTVLQAGQVIEDYPEDARGHSCLILGYGDDNRPLHVVCSPKDEFLAVITAYLPDPAEWSANFRTRKRR